MPVVLVPGLGVVRYAAATTPDHLVFLLPPLFLILETRGSQYLSMFMRSQPHFVASQRLGLGADPILLDVYPFGSLTAVSRGPRI
jgi:hypothetical protein